MPVADLVNGEIQVQADWRTKKIMESVPGLNYRSSDDVWHGTPAWSTCVVLRDALGQRLTIGSTLQEWMLQAWHSWISENIRIRDMIEPDGTITITDERLYPHQHVGAQFMAAADALICDEMGTGKSVVTLTALRQLEDPYPVMLICPNSVKHHWAREAATWLPEANAYPIDGSAVKRVKQLAEAAEDPTALVVMNYESVRRHSRLAGYPGLRLIRCRECGGYDEDVTVAKCHKHPRELNEIDWKTVIVDEAHRMKDPTSQQTRACWAIQHHPTVARRWALTGTPIASDVGDLWSLLHGISPMEFRSKTKFVGWFALLAWNPHAALDIVGVRPDRRLGFERVVYPRMRRMLKDIVLPNLPPKVRIMREAPMTPKQAKAYKEMEDEMLAELESGDIVIAKTNLTKATRLLQFSSAYTEVQDDLQLKLSEPSPKIDVLLEILEELGDRQVAVCALSRQLIELTAARLDAVKPEPISYRLLTGAVPTAVRAQNLVDFQRGLARCMLFTVQAGGVGVSMTAADTIVFLQRSWSMIDNKQAEDRVHRVGSEQHESITVIDIVAPDTIEVRQLDRLQEKAEQLEDVVRDIEQRRAAGLDTPDDLLF